MSDKQAEMSDPMGRNLPPNERFIKDSDAEWQPDFAPLGQPAPVWAGPRGGDAPPERKKPNGAPPQQQTQAEEQAEQTFPPPPPPLPHHPPFAPMSGSCGPRMRRPRAMRPRRDNSKGVIIMLIIAAITGWWWMLIFLIPSVFKPGSGLSNNRTIGIVMIGVGITFFVSSLGLQSGAIMPMVLVLAGVFLLLRASGVLESN